MARAARQISIDPSTVQIVHVYNRCVRRAFLCGQDPVTGKNFEHHTHQILRSRPDIVATWSDREVATRWLRISPKRDDAGQPLTESQINMLLNNSERIAEIRVRLSDVDNWLLNEMRYRPYFASDLKREGNRMVRRKSLSNKSRHVSEGPIPR